MSDFDRWDDDDATEEHLSRLAQELTDDDRLLIAPPPDLWRAIRSELDADAVGAADLEEVPPAPHDDVVRPFRQRERRSPVWKAGLATAAALALFVAGAAFVTRNSNEPTSTVVASVDIANDDLQVPFDGEGKATLVRDGSDHWVVDLELPDLPAADGDYEVWLINTDQTNMVSLGTATAGEVELEVPVNYDPEQFPVVDVSVEPRDGDPTHSGQSILRGVLDI